MAPGGYEDEGVGVGAPDEEDDEEAASFAAAGAGDAELSAETAAGCGFASPVFSDLSVFSAVFSAPPFPSVGFNLSE